MIQIEIVNNNQCLVKGPIKVTNKLYEAFRIKHPNAWHILKFQKGKSRWDGYINYINDRGFFKIGLLYKVYNTLIDWGEKVNIVDLRPKLPDFIIPKRLGDKDLYPRQIKALETLLNNKIGNTPFLVCAGDYAVGFGKSLLFCAIHEAFKRKLPTILLLNDSDLFNQFKNEIPPLLPGEDVKFIQGSKINSWGNFNVAMVQSLSRNLKNYQYDLSQMGIVLIDEADIIDNKTYSSVIQHLYNSQIRIGLSGTIYMSKLKKDLVHNMNIMSFIGDKVDQVKLIDQINSGRATPITIKIIYIDNMPFKENLDYQEEYKNIISNNPLAYKISYSRMLYNAKRNRIPMIIYTKYIEHCEKLYQFYKRQLKKDGLNYSIEFVHHETKNRKEILENFRNGKIDILICTTIISRGKNFPLLKYLQNTASMDSNEKSIQVLGRLIRQHESKSKVYLDDLNFPGKYLRRHGNHRKNFYLKESLKVIKIEGKF